LKNEICPVCGLPKDLCVCDSLDKEETRLIKVYTSKAKFNKVMTVVEGITKNQLKSVMKDLKRWLACGGSIKGNTIILQGNHKRNIVNLLVKLGFKRDMIEVV